MSIRNTVRVLPALFRVGFAGAVAYRAELLIWVLTTTMPLIMLALWTAVARDAPIGRFGAEEFVLYFLATFVVRQLTSSWAAWEMNYEIRTGSLSARLLRPVHPLWNYAVENVAAIPMRLIIAVPVAVAALWIVGRDKLPHDARLWFVWFVAMLGAWLITFLANVAIGCLSLFMESSLKVMDVWLAAFFVFSGYLIPIELFPPGLRVVADWLPFRYQIGLPVEILTSAHTFEQNLPLLLRQWSWVAGSFVITWLFWRVGLKRFAAYGG